MLLNTKSGRQVELPTVEEDAAITAAAIADVDTVLYSEEEWQAIKPQVRRGRPSAEITKERITIRLSRDVVEQFRATGDGWQTRIDFALQEWLKEHSLA